METKKYVEIKDLEVYRLAKELSAVCWKIYEGLNWQDKKIMGEQFIQSIDSIGANIAEGYGRYHYSDKIKFYYNARASLYEGCQHWLELLYERGKIGLDKYTEIKSLGEKLAIKLNNFIAVTYKAKYKNEL